LAQTRTTPEGITQQLAKALAHPLRVRILTSLHRGISSPNQLAQELDEPLGNVSYHVKTLLEYDCVELVKTEPRRGAVEHFYRATERAFFSDADWAKIPASARKGIEGVILESIGQDATAALTEGTIDARTDSHVSRRPRRGRLDGAQQAARRHARGRDEDRRGVGEPPRRREGGGHHQLALPPPLRGPAQRDEVVGSPQPSTNR
jgi:DNA-binding transcriptional ArsR family regulator